MSRLAWGTTGERLFEAGIDRGVLYVAGQDGVPWNGLTEVSEKPSGGSATPYYIDGFKYLNVSSPEEYGATITAFTYPDEFLVCDGTVALDGGFYIKHQPRQSFNLAYRSFIGNDVSGTDFAYKIHLIYNALAEPTDSDNKTLTDSTEPDAFSWSISLMPVEVDGYRGSGHYIIDSRYIHPGALTALEDILYGTADTDPRIPVYAEIMSTIASYASISVNDNGDGSYTLTADDDALIINLDGTFELTSNAVTLDGDQFVISTN